MFLKNPCPYGTEILVYENDKNTVKQINICCNVTWIQFTHRKRFALGERVSSDFSDKISKKGKREHKAPFRAEINHHHHQQQQQLREHPW